jgi:membrane-associated protease RseP (regulator of RpoE activity)
VRGSTGRIESLEYAPEFVFRGLWTQGWWLNLLLFVLTFLTTTIFGFALTRAFSTGEPLDVSMVFAGYARLTRGDTHLWTGLQFSVPLLLILLAHEFGHYFDCWRWNVDGSLPYFLPSPTLFGTCGAFIRIRSPIYSRQALFDIGVSGPIAGFVMLIPFLVLGVSLSHIVPAAAHQTRFVFGTPLALRALEALRFPHVPAVYVSLHPVAVAAWAGLLATAINLLPMGQLDGGHILYAVLGERWHRYVTLAFIAVLVVLGFFYWAWWVWAALLFLFGRRHPLVYDQTPLSRGRVWLSAAALVMFLLSFSLVPVSIS